MTVARDCQGDGRPVAGRIVVAQAAHDRAHLPHDRIGDDARDVVNQRPSTLADPRRALDRAVARDRAERERLVADAEVVQILQGVDVDEHGGARQPEAHRWNQALPAGEHAGVAAVLLELGERFGGGVGANVVEGRRDHVTLLP